MKIYFLLVLVLPFISCFSNRSLVEVKYRVDPNGKTYRIAIPKGAAVSILEGSHEIEHQYWYPDSSVIYVTNDRGVSPINYDRIYKLGETYYKRQFEAEQMTLSGFENGLAWKDKKLREISIGYANVPRGKKEIFDNALESVKE